MSRAVFLTVAVLAVMAAFGPARAGAGPPPFTHILTFENTSLFPADGIAVEVSDYTYQVDVVDQPKRCPEPEIDTGTGFAFAVSWGVLCLRPGNSVTVLLYGECDPCPPPDTVYYWTRGALGDANCSNTRDAIDAAVVLQYAAGLLDTVPCEDRADANGSGDITAVDAAIILQIDAGLILL